MSKCVVCHDFTYSNYYEALACDPCRTFFRRQVLNPKDLRCRKENNCIITIDTRRACNSCRFNKCLKLGMKPYLVEKDPSRKKRNEILGNSQLKLNSLVWNSKHSPFICASPCCPRMVTVVRSIPCASSVVTSNSVCPSTSKYDAGQYLTLKMRKDPSKLNFHILGYYGLVCNQYDIVIEVPVVNGDIAGTSLNLNELVKNETRLNFNHGNMDYSLTLESRAQYQIFSRRPNDLSLVTVSDILNENVYVMTMQSFTDQLWSCLKQIVNTARFLREAMEVYYHLPDDGNAENEKQVFSTHEEPEFKQLVLTVSQANLTKQISLGIESLPTFKGLPVDDQFIVLKEALLPVCFLIVGHCFDHSCDSFVFSAFRDRAMFCIHKFSMKSDNYAEPMEDLYTEFCNNFYDFLRKDFFIVAVLSLISIFRYRDGTSCGELFEIERSFCVKILEKYIQAKIESQQWGYEFNVIWHHIMQWMDHVEKIISVYSKFACDQERALNSKPY